jgi:cytochrome P450
MGGLSIGRVAVVSDPAAIRRVLLENCANYPKDWMQRRILSAGLTNGLLSAEGNQWKAQRRALAPLFLRKAVLVFSDAMVKSAQALVDRLSRHQDQVVDIAVEATRTTLDVLERTIFSDGFGRGTEEIRVAMKGYFDTIGRIDPLDLLGLPGVVPRPTRWRLRPMMRLFEEAIDTIISTRRRQIAEDKADVPRDILTLLLEARDSDTGEALSEVEIRANILTFIAAGQETTANCITWSLFLLSQSPEWRQRSLATSGTA